MSRLLLAAAAIVATTAVASCGFSNPLADPAFPGAAGTIPTAAAVYSVTERVAAEYAVAARELDPQEVRRLYRLQLVLSGPPLRDQLLAVGPPTRADVRELARDHARTMVSVIRARSLKSAAPDVLIAVELNERSVSTGTVTEREVTYRATATRTANGQWLVTTFTAQP